MTNTTTDLYTNDYRSLTTNWAPEAQPVCRPLSTLNPAAMRAEVTEWEANPPASSL
jgi:hypothetical protein